MCSDSLALGRGGARVPIWKKEGMLQPRPQGFFFIKMGVEVGTPRLAKGIENAHFGFP